MRVQLQEVCVKASSNIAQKDLENHIGEYPIYGASGFIKTVDFYKHEKPYVAVVKDGAGVGRTMLLPEKSSVIGTMQALIPNEKIAPELLKYVVQNMHLENSYTGATIPHIYFKDYCKKEFDLPDKKQQVQIIKILSTIEEIIENYHKELKLLDLLIKSRFVEVFGDMADPKCKWNKCKLVEVCKDSDDIKCGPFGTQLGKEEYTSSGVAVWEIPQINSNFETHPTHFVTAEKANTLASYSIQPGDIAMSRKGNVGRCAVFPHEFENGIIHSDVLRIRVDDSKIDPEFLMRQLHYSGDIERQIELVSSGAIMAGINVTKLKNIFVFVPPKALQKVFVSFVHEVNKSKSVIQKSLEEAQLLFDSLMQEYFE